MKNTSDKKPMVLVIAGPNGSGKSTVTAYIDVIGEYTNADDIVRSTGMHNEDAARLVDQKRYDAIQERRDFSFETVLASHYKMDILSAAKEAGFFIKCIFVTTCLPRINVARVKARVAAGGHDVDANTVVSRYHKSLAQIKTLMQLCDILHVYDNTETFQRIIRKHKDEITVYENAYWSVDEILQLLEE